jgi:streptogramin lyase
LSCTYCHSLERILKSTHNAEQFVPVITRMARYFEDGSALPTGTSRARAMLKEKERLAAAEKSPNWFGDVTKAELASYLATVNLNGRTESPFPLKTLPRPSGIATRVIVTTWEIPRKDAVAHDADVDSKGRIWYNEENSWVVGVLNPQTNTFTEYPLEPAERDPGIAGSRDIMVDKQDNVWLPLRKGSGAVLHKFDPTTKTLTKVEGTEGAGAFGDVSPDGAHVWLGFVRVDVKTAKVDGDFRKPANIQPGRQAGGYGFAVNTKGNPYGTDFMGSRILGVDVRTNEITYWPTRQQDAYPRRGRIDAQDRFWLGIYGGDAIGMLDTKTGDLKEWKMPTPFTTPYTATVPDRNGYVYSSSNTSERILRLNPKTGEIVEFPMPNGPGNFDAKKMSFDPTTKKPVLLFANVRNAEIMRVELPD